MEMDELSAKLLAQTAKAPTKDRKPAHRVTVHFYGDYWSQFKSLKIELEKAFIAKIRVEGIIHAEPGVFEVRLSDADILLHSMSLRGQGTCEDSQELEDVLQQVREFLALQQGSCVCC